MNDNDENQEQPKSHEAEEWILLPNYKPNCRRCFGRGHTGKDKHGNHIPCPKCFKNSEFFLNERTGELTNPDAAKRRKLRYGY